MLLQPSASFQKGLEGVHQPIGVGDAEEKITHLACDIIISLSSDKSIGLVAFDSNEHALAISCSNKLEFLFWTLTSHAKARAETPESEACYTTLVYTAATTTLLSGASNGVVKLREVGGGIAQELVRLKSFVKTMATSLDGHRAVVGCSIHEKGNVQCLDLQEKTVDWSLDFTSAISCSAISKKGLFVLAGFCDGTIQMIDCKTQQITCVTSHSGQVNCLAFTLDEKAVLSGWEDGSVRCTNLETKISYCFDVQSKLLALVVSPNGRYAFGGSEENGLVTLDINAKKSTIANVDEKREPPMCKIAISPDGKKVLSGSNDSLYLWDVQKLISSGGLCSQL